MIAAYSLRHRGDDIESVVAFYVPVVAATIALIAVPFTRRRGTYYIAQLTTLGMYVVASLSVADSPSLQTILLTLFIGEVVLYEPYPSNLIATLALTITVITTHVLAYAPEGEQTMWPMALVENYIPLAVYGIALSVFGSFMTKYRELIVTMSTSHKQLMDSTVNLARANTRYQDYAVGARERAARAERQRITRDIHDIVGYTLTNNMMLMEAALDLIKENPLAIPAIVETARASAQEGLDQVRSSMYKFRDQETPLPIGLNAIIRLVRVFEKAAGIRIECDFCNMPVRIDERTDSTIYHMVQEALVNSFRHGRAKNVRIAFWREGDEVDVRVQDDGVGATRIIEGIGLRGMRERITELGGDISVESGNSGFLIAATIPVAPAAAGLDIRPLEEYDADPDS